MMLEYLSETKETYYYSVSGKFVYEPYRFIYRDNVTQFAINEHLFIWVLYHLTDGKCVTRYFDYTIDSYRIQKWGILRFVSNVRGMGHN